MSTIKCESENLVRVLKFSFIAISTTPVGGPGGSIIYIDTPW